MCVQEPECLQKPRETWTAEEAFRACLENGDSVYKGLLGLHIRKLERGKELEHEPPEPEPVSDNQDPPVSARRRPLSREEIRKRIRRCVTSRQLFM
jgi:hypothetical protein